MPPTASILSRRSALVLAPILSLLVAAPSQAHHAMEGRTAGTAAEGFLSGLAHPVIGIDHLAMIVAIGLLAAAVRPGFWLAATFVLAAMAGAALHLLGINLPGSEILVALSVVAAGAFLAFPRSPGAAFVLSLGAVAGILHGYAYGESIFGAEATPLAAYLAGFTAVQLLVAAAVYAVARTLRAHSPAPALTFRPAGYMVAGAGLALVAMQIVAIALPVS